MFKTKPERFEVIFRDNAIKADSQIIKDKETGVLYHFASNTVGAGLTPLLDSEGKPIVESV